MATMLWQLRDTWLIISIMFLLILAFTRVLFPKYFVAAYNPFKFFSFRIRDDFGTGLRLLSTEYLHFTFLLSAAIVFNLMIINEDLAEQAFLPKWLNPTGELEGVLIWLGLSVVVVLCFLLRYLMISGFGRLFNFPNSQSRHFQEAQSLNQVFVLAFTSVVLVVLYSGFSFPASLMTTLIVLSIIYVIYRQINLYVKFLSAGLYSKLFIFSYLCTTEIIPALIGIKLLL